MAETSEGLKCHQVMAFTRGQGVGTRPEAVFPRVSTDSRDIRPGDLFVALRGPSFDGHDFVEPALEAGAGGILAQRSPGRELLRRHDAQLILVPDTLAALGDLAAGWRRSFSTPVGVLTGSSGKTTTKEMVVGILRRCFSCLWSPGNHNNRIGLPMALLRLRTEHDRVFLEMGMNEPGEIGRLTWIARPQVGALLNIGTAHVGMFPTSDALARAKGEMLEEMPQESVFVYNGDDGRVARLAETWKGPRRSFGLSADSDIHLVEAADCGLGQKIRMRIRDEVLSFDLPQPGHHSLYNALAAAAVADSLGAPGEAIREGLAQFEGVRGRLVISRRDRFNLMDDSYNANPDSMKAALEVLARMNDVAERILVLGDMLELGDFSEQAHLELGARAARLNPVALYVKGQYGPFVKQGALEAGLPEDRVIPFEEPGDAAGDIRKRISARAWILVKGSRGMALEKVVQALEEASAPAEK